MLIDPEFKAPLRKKLNELVNDHVSGLMNGKFDDMVAFERHRGIITGLGLALNLLEDKPETSETHTEDEQYGKDAD